MFNIARIAPSPPPTDPRIVAADGGFVASGTGFDQFMGAVHAAGTQPVITVNYGSGTPAEAAAWVQYANKTKGYGVKYWEVGNEVYRNGEYGSSWEYDTHSSHSATAYANNLLQYISAMKAVDPTIKIGAVLTTVDGATDYGDYGIVSSGSSCEPAANTPFPAYYAIEMVHKLGSPGDTLVKASSSSSLLTAHAVRRSNGNVDVMLINKDPNNAATVSLNYSGFTPSSSTPTVYTYLKNGHSIASSATGSTSTQTVPAYSIVDIQLQPSGSSSGGSGAPVRAVGAGKCLDVNGGSTTPGTQLQIWDCNGGSNQAWTYTSAHQLTVYGGSSQMCLDAYGNGTTDGTKVDIWGCNGGANQQWNVNANGTITGVQSGLCLDMSGASTADGALVDLWSCTGGSNQQWSGA